MKKGFRDEFKCFKGKDFESSFPRVVNFNRINDPDCPHANKIALVKLGKSKVDWVGNFGMKQPSDWEIYSFLKKPGKPYKICLLFIKNPFHTYGQRYWVIRCLEYYTRKPSKLNIDAHAVITTNEDWWEFCQRKGNENRAGALEKLRWATFGYHHNWDTKVYSEFSKCDFPSDLKALCSFLGREMNFSEFNAQAAIINMYHFGCSLSGHTDHSEVNIQAPLFSFSFGQSAIFLIGGKSIADEAIPILLESGDIIIMSEDSRLCYHGVPKILSAQGEPWNMGDKHFGEWCNSEYYCKEVTNKLWNNKVWEPFENYIRKSRININVRQVLLPGQEVLES